MSPKVKPAMHETVSAALSRAKTPTHATIADVLTQLAPIAQLVVKVQLQIAEHRGLLLTAQLEHPESDGHTERLHQTLGAMERHVAEILGGVRGLRVDVLQYDRYADEIAKEYA